MPIQCLGDSVTLATPLRCANYSFHISHKKCIQTLPVIGDPVTVVKLCCDYVTFVEYEDCSQIMSLDSALSTAMCP